MAWNYKIAHIITGLSTGGAEMTLLKLLAENRDGEFEAVIISLTDKGNLGHRVAELGVPLYTLNMTPARPSLAALLQLRALLTELKPNVIQGWMYHGNLAASLGNILQLHRVPVVWNIRHSLDDLETEKRSTQRIIRIGGSLSGLPNTIIYNSHYSATQHQAIGYSKKQNVIIPNGFDCDVFVPSPEKRANIRSELGVNEKEYLIGMIARYHPVKDYKNFLCAAGMLSKQYEHVRFLCAGYQMTVDNAELYTLVKEYNLEGKVFLLGLRRDIPAINATLDIATLSSKSEAFPNVVCEAMACEVPCVVTHVGDAEWIVGATGKIVPVAQPDALARAWVEMIEMGEANRKVLGRMARQRVRKKFSLKHVGKLYKALYRSLI